MDLTFKTELGRFNYRVCALILHEGHLLAMRDERMPYYYLPGGRVKLHETAQEALLRELNEELGIYVDIVRPLWLNQSFFIEDVTKEKFHELCLYFLVDGVDLAQLQTKEKFMKIEGKLHHHFEWLAFETLKDCYLYPEFIKESIFDFPKEFTLRIERE